MARPPSPPRSPAPAPGPTDAWLAQAAALAAAGRRAEAADLYRAVLARRPGDAAALHGLGALLLAAGDAAAAEPLLAKAAARGGGAGQHLDHGRALAALGRDAAPALRLALRRAPRDAALAAEARHLLALARVRARDPAGAEAAWRGALALAPDDIRCWSGLGSLLRAVRRPAEAALAAGRAAALRPGLAEAHANHGDALREAGALAEAEAALRRAVALGPGRAELLAGLGAVLKAADRPEAAAAVFAAAVALAPDHPRIQGNLAQARHAANRLDAAAAAHRRALLLAPGDPDLRFAAAQTALARGEIAAGFDLHEGGFAAGLRPVRHAGLPAWDGSPLAGRTILVWREQGVGDELHFASCYADLIAAAGHVVIEAEPRLVPLMRRSFPAATVVPEDGAPPEVLARVELQVAAGSLPRFLRRRPEDFPRRAGHLVPDPAAVAARRAELAALGPGPKVGIAWRSARGRHAVAAEVSRIADWEPLLRRPGLRFVGLQYDDSAEERAFALERFGAPIHVVPGLDLRGDLDGGAALTAALDLVVSVPISAADMATAVGTPLWLVARLPHPRLLGQAEYPWGRNVRPFGRRPDEPWSAVLARVAAALPGG